MLLTHFILSPARGTLTRANMEEQGAGPGRESSLEHTSGHLAPA